MLFLFDYRATLKKSTLKGSKPQSFFYIFIGRPIGFSVINRSKTENTDLFPKNLGCFAKWPDKYTTSCDILDFKSNIKIL